MAEELKKIKEQEKEYEEEIASLKEQQSCIVRGLYYLSMVPEFMTEDKINVDVFLKKEIEKKMDELEKLIIKKRKEGGQEYVNFLERLKASKILDII